MTDNNNHKNQDKELENYSNTEKNLMAVVQWLFFLVYPKFFIINTFYPQLGSDEINNLPVHRQIKKKEFWLMLLWFVTVVSCFSPLSVGRKSFIVPNIYFFQEIYIAKIKNLQYYNYIVKYYL